MIITREEACLGKDAGSTVCRQSLSCQLLEVFLEKACSYNLSDTLRKARTTAVGVILRSIQGQGLSTASRDQTFDLKPSTGI